MLIKLVMRKFYREAAGDPTKLPWHNDSPIDLLRKAAAAKAGGRALDVGCGAGVFSAWLAKQGLRVTGIDMFSEAIAMSRALADREGVEVELVQGDIFSFEPEQPFDVVFDSGCLHSLVGGSLPAYKRQLGRWLAPDGEFVLAHWGKRHAMDWRPIGPRRRSAAAIDRLFGDRLTRIEREDADFAAPLPFGPTVRGSSYRYRAGA